MPENKYSNHTTTSPEGKDLVELLTLVISNPLTVHGIKYLFLEYGLQRG
jgi:hypothetical protein